MCKYNRKGGTDKMRTYKSIDLFAGIGGIRLGFEKAFGKQIETVDTRNCIIHTTNFKKVVVQGLDGYLIVEQNGELLICKIAEEKNFHNRK